MIFTAGSIDPNLALGSITREDHEKWSPGIELMLRQVPDTRVLLAIVSGVVSPHFRWNPPVKLTGDDHKQRSFAEIMQVIQQMIFPNSIDLSPRLIFSYPLTNADLTRLGESLLVVLITQSRSLLDIHMSQPEYLLPTYISLND